MQELKRYLHRKYNSNYYRSKLAQIDSWLDSNETQILESYNPAELISDYAKKLFLPITEDDTSAFDDIISKMERTGNTGNTIN